MTTNDPRNPYPQPYGDSYSHSYSGYDSYYGYDPAPQAPPQAPQPPQPGRSARRRGVLSAGIGALAAAVVVGGAAVVENLTSTVTGSGSTAAVAPTTPGSGGSSAGNGTLPGTVNPNGRSGTATSVALATAQQQKGIVTVVSVLKYQNAESAGTGMVLSSNGEILTNNHVVNGATSITVTVASTGSSYRADVVGTDPSDDVAVLQLRNASGLTTARVGNSSGIGVGDKIVGVGNAGGTGALRASSGTVTALNRSITATDENGSAGEKLTGLIQVNAAIISGDSGGPLYDSAGDIVGMNTAASANAAAATAYAIPIDSARSIADRIETRVETSTIHIGLPPFLGVGVGAGGTQGASVTSLLDGGPAAAAGITDGSVITAIDGKAVTSADSLKSVLRAYRPGQRISVGWTDAAGASHTATVTLATGPAD